MKPIRLEVENLRSFRTKRVISFVGLELFAILGDTGAGKTSILEAITYALFNRSTWSGKNVRELVSKGAKTMSVTFVFSVDGDEFTVTRILKAGSGVSQHRLRCPTRGIDVNLDENVNKAISEALHLDDEAFLHTVLLPQGKHAELLTVTGTKRSEILSELFRLDELSEVSQLAKSLQFRADGLLQGYASQRAILPAEPEQVVQQAQALVASQTARYAAASAAVDVVTTLDATLADTARTLTELRQRSAQLEGAQDIASLLDALRLQDDELTKRRGVQCDLLARALDAKREAETALQGLATAGLDSASVLRCESALEMITDAALEISREREQLAERARLAAESRTLFEETRAELLTRRETMESARHAADEAETGLTALRPKLRLLEATKAAYDAAVLARSASEARLAVRSDALIGADERLEAAAALVAEAQEEQSRAVAAHAQARIADGAAAIAAHLHAGDDCPVCDRVLPPDFVAPQSPGLDAAKRAEDTARAALRKADIAKGQLERLIETQRRDENEARRDFADREAAVVDAYRHFAAAADTQDEEPATSLRRIGETVTDLQAALPELRKALETATALHSDAQGRGIALDAAAKQHDDAATALSASLAERRKRLQARIASLPPMFSPGADLGSMEAAREAVAASLEKSNSLDAKAALAAEDIAAANREISAIDRERSSSILVPRSRLHERLNVIAKLLCLEGCPEEEVAQAAWAVAVIAMVDVERERLAERCEAAQSVWEDHQRRRLAVVAELDAEPSSALAAASTELRNAESALTSAQTALAHATELAERMKKLHPVKAGLVGLRECLGANGFPAYATQQRQLRLLEIGSIILSDMTDGRYRFTNDFSIFDRDVNDARSAHTLSGGEKFLASLALSLAVVEIASSAGAKIESLFLDEGFASLDAETLEIAMLELRKRTRAGRTICVISHLSQVTQFVTDTLLVEAKDEGSTVSRIAGPVDEDSDVVEGLVNQLALR